MDFECLKTFPKVHPIGHFKKGGGSSIYRYIAFSIINIIIITSNIVWYIYNLLLGTLTLFIPVYYWLLLVAV